MKKQACDHIGIEYIGIDLSDAATQDEIEGAVQELNDNPKVNGILVQLPLPKGIDENAVLDRISPEKDADGLHPLNIAHLALRGREPRYIACTPHGCLKLIQSVKEDISGMRACVLGRSNIVGMPMSHLLNNANATVTVCHSRTKNIEEIVKQSDIVVAAIGQPQFVQGDWIKEGAIVIDVGIQYIDDAKRKSGK